MKQHDIFHRDPDIIGGAPVFTGTRVPVDSLISHLKRGNRLEGFLADFPSVRANRRKLFFKWPKRLY